MMLKPYFSNPNTLEAGCDEVGRGCLAGPVVAAAVILPSDFYHPYLNDSKKINAKKRMALDDIIKEHAICYAIAEVSPAEIDQINILNASFLAMHKALDQLNQKPELILVDGNRFKAYKKIKYECIIKGDGKFCSIAAASIIAKNYRDQLMVDLAKEFPPYMWHKNVGYPTAVHKAAIAKHGITPYHRKSYKLENRQLAIFD